MCGNEGTVLVIGPCSKPRPGMNTILQTNANPLNVNKELSNETSHSQ